MGSKIPANNPDDMEINERLFRPGVLDYMRTIAEKDGAKILSFFKESGEKIIAAFIEVKKILKNIIFIPTEDRNKYQDSFEAIFFISPDGTINFG